MSKPFELLDLLDKYIRHNITYYAHGHATEPDGVNACVKAIEAELKAFELDNYAIPTLSDGANTVTAQAAREHLDDAVIHRQTDKPYLVLSGDGTGHLAAGNTSALLPFNFVTIPHLLLVRGTVIDAPCSLIKRLNSAQAVIWELGIDANWYLYLTINGTTVTATDACGETYPTTMGCVVDSAGVQFFGGGYLDTKIAQALTLTGCAADDTIILGDGLHGHLIRVAVRRWSTDLIGTSPVLDVLPQFHDCPPAHQLYLDLTGGTINNLYDTDNQQGTSTYAVVNGTWVGRDGI